MTSARREHIHTEYVQGGSPGSQKAYRCCQMELSGQDRVVYDLWDLHSVARPGQPTSTGALIPRWRASQQQESERKQQLATQ